MKPKFVVISPIYFACLPVGMTGGEVDAEYCYLSISGRVSHSPVRLDIPQKVSLVEEGGGT